MPATPTPQRVRRAMTMLAVGPNDLVLEIGCGRGMAVSTVCERLTGGSGRMVAIDRSAAMIRAAEQRNRDWVAVGRAAFKVGALDSADFGERRFDTIFAINVSLFWMPGAERGLEAVRRLLRPRGALHVFHELERARALPVAQRAEAYLTGNGFAVTATTIEPMRSTALVSIVARPVPGTRPSQNRQT